MGLDLSGVVNEILFDLCDSDDYVVVYETGGTVDPDSGQWFPGTEQRIQLDSALEDTTSFGLIDGINIESGDIFLMIPPLYNLPDVNYWLEVRGDRYSVVNKLPFYNTGVLQYRELQLRRS